MGKVIGWGKTKSTDSDWFWESKLNTEIFSRPDVNIYTIEFGFQIVKKIFVLMVRPIVWWLVKLNFEPSNGLQIISS